MQKSRQQLNASVPTVLYKYLPPERIDILEGMQIRFSRPSEFNDIFDSHFLVKKAKGKQAIGDRFKLKMRLGIFCLAESPDNHLMWVNYARNHTGFVLGFDANAPFFCEEGRTLRKVEYRDKPRVVQEVDMDACFCKAKTWEHEEEWRCVRLFERPESRETGIEPGLIKEVIFGAKMEGWQIARIMYAAKVFEITHTTKFLLCKPSDPSWSIDIRPKNVSVCDKCDGNGYLMEDIKDD
ncbi:MAG: DUF2971 domain-containing protein [Candidatus Acidiferrales bacterium]